MIVTTALRFVSSVVLASHLRCLVWQRYSRWTWNAAIMEWFLSVAYFGAVHDRVVARPRAYARNLQTLKASDDESAQ